MEEIVRALIVAKTHIHYMACVGALSLDGNKGVRLLQPDGSNQPGDTPYEVGQIWDLECRPRPDIRPPHVEDVLVYGAQLVGREPRLRAYLIERVQPWRGAPTQTFEGLVRPTYGGSGYVNEIMGLPAASTGFWLPDQELTLEEAEHSRLYYRYPKTGYKTPSRTHPVCLLRYVGYAPAIDTIPAGTLVRISLARWWRQEDSDIEERCYLQLSGWYL